MADGVGEDRVFLDAWGDLIDVLPDPPSKRVVCDKCLRPSTACWCPYLPREPLSVRTTIYILQHPFEERKRSCQTGIMLKNGLAPGKCKIFQGKRFNLKKFPELESMISDPNTILVFPGPKAVDLDEYAKTCCSETSVNLILLDGTWPQARGIYNKSPFLHNLRQVQLSDAGLSEYVIRTQPNDSSLSTLETAAIALSAIEHSPGMRERRCGLTFKDIAGTCTVLESKCSNKLQGFTGPCAAFACHVQFPDGTWSCETPQQTASH